MKTAAAAVTGPWPRATDFLALTKPRLNSLVVATAGIGYYLGTNGQLSLSGLAHTVIGAGLVAGAAAAFNQITDRDIDGVMDRTRQRPLPAGRIHPTEAGLFAFGLAVAGTLELAYATNWTAAAVALLSLISYVLIYSPMKRRTPWATLVGAVPGALPAVIGWTAARNSLGIEAWVLFGIVFFWQLPHFHALSWLYREDFKRAELPLLVSLDPSGRKTATHAFFFALVLFPMSLTPSLIGLGGATYLTGASVLSIAFVTTAIRFCVRRSTDRAYTLFLVSLVYLPMLWGLLVIERVF